jgi:hypothetical protein
MRYPPDRLLAEAASLFNLLGGIAPKHLVIVGGLVPSLLLSEPRVPHRGSGDLDLSLSVAITKGQTARYYKSLEEAIDPYFEPAESGFRWRKRKGVEGIPLLVDFLGPEVEATQIADGTLALEDETAAANTGTRLRPYPISAGRLVDLDAESKVIEKVSLIYAPGVRADVRIRHAGPLGFLASKAEALETRSEAKDGYDVSWWCLEAGKTPEEVADQVSERPAFADPDFLDSVAMLKSAFGAPDYPGPTGYARELHDVAEPGSDEFDRTRNEAFAAVSPVLELLLERALKAAGADPA